MLDRMSVNPERLGLNSKRLQIALDLMDAWARSGEVPASAICLGRRAGITEGWFAGRRSSDPDSPAIRRDALFLIASLTKPATAVAVMMLVERGLLTLDDFVCEHIPEFSQNGKESVRVRHLLTHTSGLPDQLPNNADLRALHAPIERFVEETCRQPLLFAAGSAVRYQSSGFAILGELVLRLTRSPLPDFLRDDVFTPLGMAATSLGWNPLRRDRQTLVRLEPADVETDWHWNTSYWLSFGAPWGGLISSPSDYARFLQMMLNGGSLGDVRILSPASVRAMRMNQLDAMLDISEEDRNLRPWGLGWQLERPGASPHFGDLLGPRTFGHWGATGAVAWADPDLDAIAVILTTRPQGDGGRYLARLSNVLASSFV